MTQTQQFDSDVAAVEPEGQINFLFQGKSFICQRVPILDKLGMVDAGFEEGFDFSIEVRNSQFVASLRAPVNADIITIGDTQYTIVATSPDQFGVVTHYAVKQYS